MIELVDFYGTYGVTYGTGYGLVFFCNFLIYAFSALLASYVLYASAFFFERITRKIDSQIYRIGKHEESDIEVPKNDASTMDIKTESMRKRNDIEVSKNDSPTLNIKTESWRKRMKLAASLTITSLRFLAAIASWCSLPFFAIAPSILSAFDIIPIWLSIILTFLVFMIKYIGLIYAYSPNYLNKPQEQKTFLQRFWRRLKVTSSLHQFVLGMFLMFAAICTFGVPFLTQGVCFNVENTGYGIKYEGLGFSSSLTRYFQLETVCSEGEICHVYSTLPEDGSNSVILNVHTGMDVTTIQIGYGSVVDGSEDNIIERIVTAQSFHISLEKRGDRYMHSAYLSGLTNNTKYYFEIYFNNETQHSNYFVTLPSPELERPVLIATGGDVGTTQKAKDMTSVLSSYDIDAIVVGGDLAYDNAMRSCYYSYDLFISFYEDLNKKAGRLIPMMTSVGNHDVGFDAYKDAKVDVSETLYFTYFPQQSATDESGNLLYQVPELENRLSYTYHIVGNTLHFLMDSGYLLEYGGVQSQFIDQVSTGHPNLLKYANYHVPVYPGCVWDDSRTMSEPKQHWIPLFEKHKFVSVFENHNHLYKKTYPMVNGVANHTEGATGIVYFGDGNWGTTSDSPCLKTLDGNSTGHVEVATDMRHVWLINVTSDTLSHFAVNQTNQIFDQVYDFSVSSYISA